MAPKTIDASVADFESNFETLKSDPSPIKLILFLADKDPATSRSWCPARKVLSEKLSKDVKAFLRVRDPFNGKYMPDCNVAEPAIYEKLGASAADVALLRAYVGDRPTWRNPSHPLRIDQRFKIKGVPTLIRWENDGIVGRLEDYEAHVGSKIDSLLAAN